MVDSASRLLARVGRLCFLDAKASGVFQSLTASTDRFALNTWYDVRVSMVDDTMSLRVNYGTEVHGPYEAAVSGIGEAGSVLIGTTQLDAEIDRIIVRKVDSTVYAPTVGAEEVL